MAEWPVNARLLCFDGDGRLIEWFHGQGKVGVVAPSLQTWLAVIVDLLEASRFRERPSLVPDDGFVIDFVGSENADSSSRQAELEVELMRGLQMSRE